MALHSEPVRHHIRRRTAALMAVIASQHHQATPDAGNAVEFTRSGLS